jgi:hypothetical protein
MFGKRDAQALKDMQKSIEARLQTEADSALGTPHEKERHNWNESACSSGGYPLLSSPQDSMPIVMDIQIRYSTTG